MKRLSSLLAALLLSSAIAPWAAAGAPPKVDPNAPPPQYWEPEPEQDQPAKKAKAAKKDKARKDKKADEAKH